jgi:hypothetical protein
MKYDLNSGEGETIYALRNLNIRIESNLKVGLVGRTVLNKKYLLIGSWQVINSISSF